MVLKDNNQISNKFKPYDKVMVFDFSISKWVPSIYSMKYQTHHRCVDGKLYRMCISYSDFNKICKNKKLRVVKAVEVKDRIFRVYNLKDEDYIKRNIKYLYDKCNCKCPGCKKNDDNMTEANTGNASYHNCNYCPEFYEFYKKLIILFGDVDFSNDPHGLYADEANNIVPVKIKF